MNGEWKWWEVALADEFDQAHTHHIFANSRTKAIVGAYDSALSQGFHTANDWELLRVDPRPEAVQAK